VVYGAGGVMLASPAFSGFYSVSGLVLMSTYPFLCGLDAEVFAFNNANLTGMVAAHVSGKRSASIDSASHVKIGAGPATGGGGKIGIEAQQINVGLPYDGVPTVRTTQVTVGTVNPLNRIEVKDAPGEIEVKAATAVKLVVGTWTVEVKPNGITIGTASGAPAIKIGPQNMTLSAQLVQVKDALGGQVKLQNGGFVLTGTKGRIL
jgi:hypothetical protein